jgi:hypothetical protein
LFPPSLDDYSLGIFGALKNICQYLSLKRYGLYVEVIIVMKMIEALGFLRLPLGEEALLVPGFVIVMKGLKYFAITRFKLIERG